MNLKSYKHRVGRQNAFTMIEIAIALAVIAFALVAIIGVLPTGINVQKDNREDTIVNQDGPYWIEAIRNGAKGLDHLTNYVDSITIERIGKNSSGNNINQTIIFTNSPGLFAPPLDGSMTNGQRIVGLLTLLKYEGELPNRITNTITAKVRALTGSAVEQGKANPDFSFSYALTAEVLPFQNFPFHSTNYMAYPTNSALWIAHSNQWNIARSLQANSAEIRLTFRWPLLADGKTGPNFQRFRVLASGSRVNSGGMTFLQPHVFAP